MGGFYQNGIAAIGWDDLGDLTTFKDKEEIRAKITGTLAR